MERPHVYRNGGVTLTYDAQVGFVLEDAENPHNFSIYAGGPFWTLHPTDKDRGTLLIDLRSSYVLPRPDATGAGRFPSAVAGFDHQSGSNAAPA